MARVYKPTSSYHPKLDTLNQPPPILPVTKLDAIPFFYLYGVPKRFYEFQTGAGTFVMYTVPQGKVFFLTNAWLDGASGTAGLSVGKSATDYIMRNSADTNLHNTTVMNFTFPMILRSGDQIIMYHQFAQGAGEAVAIGWECSESDLAKFI